MKYIVALFCLGLFATVHAKETTTDCPMMNQETREKIIKDPVSSQTRQGQKSKVVRM